MTAECGDFCEDCGDCIVCHEEDPCYGNNGGAHSPPVKYKEDRTMKDCIVFDIDGTLANLKHRRHFISGAKKNYDAFFDAMEDDTPIASVCTLAEMLGMLDMHSRHADFETDTVDFAVFICSGRPDSHRRQTEDWLVKHVPHLMLMAEAVLMREAGDHRSDVVVKREMLAGIRGQGYEPLFVVDDRQRVVDMWREEGITCLQCDASDWDKGKLENVKPGKLTIMVGPSGAGKSRYVADWIKPSTVVSTDQIRSDICGDFRDQSKNDQVFSAVHGIVTARISNGLDVAVDATNIRDRHRRALRDLVPKDCEIEYIVINRPMQDKMSDGGWRHGVKVKGESLMAYHENIFQSNRKAIMNGDGDPRVSITAFYGSEAP